MSRRYPVGVEPPEPRHPALERLQRWKERHVGRGRIYRSAVVLAGFVLTAVGIVIIPVPGPWSFPLILAGLALLALEFQWAENFLERTVLSAEAAKFAAAAASPLQKALGVLVFCAGLAALAAAFLVFDVPLLPG